MIETKERLREAKQYDTANRQKKTKGWQRMTWKEQTKNKSKIPKFKTNFEKLSMVLFFIPLTMEMACSAFSCSVCAKF